MVNITTRNFKLTEGIENHVYTRMEKFAKFIDIKNKINITLESNKYGNKAEVFLMLDGKPLRASVVNEDLYVAVDLLVDKMNKAIEKKLGKNNLINKNDSIKNMEYFNKNKIQSQDEDVIPKIVKRKNVSTKPMFEEEAIEQMELLDHRSFMFFNASTDKISMMYKRLDGNYGILETE